MPERIHYIEHAPDVVAYAVQMIRHQRRFALVSAIEIKGGSSREVGTLALIADDGEMFGYMSNGCLDREVQLQGAKVIAEGEPRILRYGVGSPFIDLSLPCGGSLSLLFDPAPNTHQLLSAHEAFSNRKSATIRFSTPNKTDVVFSYSPNPRLALAGRGSVFRSVVKCAHNAGFDLQVFSPDAEDLREAEKYSPLSTFHLETPQAVPELDLDIYSGFLTLFHDHDWEVSLLTKAIETPAQFIGCLGSRAAHAQRREALLALGITSESINRIKGPIGLVPSLRQAPFIAVSAMAQVIESLPRFIEQVHSDYDIGLNRAGIH